MENKNQSVVTVALFTMVVLVLPGNLLAQGTCQFQRDYPELKTGSEAQIVSSDNLRALVRLSSTFGYFNPPEEARYMAQKLDKVTYEGDGDFGKLTLHMNCSTIELHLARDLDGSLFSFRLDMEINSPAGFGRSCSIPHAIHWSPQGKHRSCDNLEIFSCNLRETEGSMNWEVGAFEFEVDGDKSLTKQGKFTTESSPCDMPGVVRPF